VLRHRRDDGFADQAVQREAGDVQHVVAAVQVRLPVRGVLLEAFLYAVPLDRHMRRIQQPELFDEPGDVGAVLRDERVAPQQQMDGDGRPEPVRGRDGVRLVVQHPPRPMVLRDHDLAVGVGEGAVDLERQHPDPRLGDERRGRPDRGEPERTVRGDALPRRGFRGRERVEQPARRVREGGGC
jgi:hypothetical protein